MKWKCRALGISKDDLFDPGIVPFAPVWTVGFNSRFFSMGIDDPGLETGTVGDAFSVGEAVIAWRDSNASKRMVVFGSGEVVCEDETDANLLFLAFL